MIVMWQVRPEGRLYYLKEEHIELQLRKMKIMTGQVQTIIGTYSFTQLLEVRDPGPQLIPFTKLPVLLSLLVLPCTDIGCAPDPMYDVPNIMESPPLDPLSVRVVLPSSTPFPVCAL